MKDYKKILKCVVNIIKTTEKSDIGFANICSYIGEKCPELKESENTDIITEIKNIITYFYGSTNLFVHHHTKEELLAWLEEQGEKDKEILVLKDQIESLHAAIKALKETHKIELARQGEQKSALGEEDEEIYRKCICAMRASACGFPEEEKFVEQVDNWLKSLKDRVQPQNTWKPSEEMLEALYRVIPENMMEKSEDDMLLDKLYQGLKYGKVLSEK